MYRLLTVRARLKYKDGSLGWTLSKTFLETQRRAQKPINVDAKIRHAPRCAARIMELLLPRHPLHSHASCRTASHAVAISCLAMQSTKEGQVSRSDFPEELEALVSKLRIDALQQFAQDVNIQGTYATFHVKTHTELIEFMKRTLQVRQLIVY
jgi:hypothetical protein